LLISAKKLGLICTDCLGKHKNGLLMVSVQRSVKASQTSIVIDKPQQIKTRKAVVSINRRQVYAVMVLYL